MLGSGGLCLRSGVVALCCCWECCACTLDYPAYVGVWGALRAFWREVGCATIIHTHALRMLLSEGVCLHHRLPSLCWGLGCSARILALRAVAGVRASEKVAKKKRCVLLARGSGGVRGGGLQSLPLKS